MIRYKWKDSHINDPKFKKYFPKKHYNNNRIDETILEIKEIVDICEKNGINLTLFLNPIHITLYLNLVIDDYIKFLSQLAQLKPIYDFSGVNKITIDNFNYYEISHYRPFIGEMIKSDILEGKNQISNLITSKNILEISALKRSEFNAALVQ